MKWETSRISEEFGKVAQLRHSCTETTTIGFMSIVFNFFISK